MRLIHTIFALFSLLLLSACGDSDNSSDSQFPAGLPRPELEFQTTDAPIDLGGVSASFSADIPYGPYERNMFNIFLPDCDGPTPLIIYIHGGGFTSGSKERYSEQQILEVLQQCVAWATIGYRLLPPRVELEQPAGNRERARCYCLTNRLCTRATVHTVSPQKPKFRSG